MHRLSSDRLLLWKEPILASYSFLGLLHKRSLLFPEASAACGWILLSVTTGGPSSSCEIAILLNNRVWWNYNFVWEYLRPLSGIKKHSQILNKNTSPYFQSASLVIWPLTMLEETMLASYPFLGLLHQRSPRLRTSFPNLEMTGQPQI